jgi:acylphosphatase
MELRAVKLKITGRVQGVSYRYYAYQQALRLGVRGWVRNKLNGSVEALIQGTDEQVREMVGWCHQGSPMAAVERVEEEPVPVEPDLDSFDVCM